jgi:hypothetical protein
LNALLEENDQPTGGSPLPKEAWKDSGTLVVYNIGWYSKKNLPRGDLPISVPIES